MHNPRDVNDLSSPFEDRIPVSVSATAFRWSWVAAFLALCSYGTSLDAWLWKPLLILAGAGWSWILATRAAPSLQLWRNDWLLALGSVMLAGVICVSDRASLAAGLVPAHPLPPQPALLLCLVPLAAMLHNAPLQRTLVGVFAVFCAWHFVSMPLEAVTGLKISWHAAAPLPRDAGPLHFQASGLAAHATVFAGFFLPLFYLAWGPADEMRREREGRLLTRLWRALPLVWVLVAMCVQSRSALAGAVAAALIAWTFDGRTPSRRTFVAAAAVALGAVLAYFALFASNKSGGDLRAAYAAFYLRAAFDGPALVFGHGLQVPAPPHLTVPGLQPLGHSHNDLVQVLYSWGLLSLAAYVAFLFALGRLVWNRALSGSVWPLCAAVALLPSLVTDLGLQMFEKSAFLVWLAATCVAWRGPRSPA